MGVEIKTNSAQLKLELGLGLSLATLMTRKNSIVYTNRIFHHGVRVRIGPFLGEKRVFLKNMIDLSFKAC